jgi:hypothetical protein
MVLLANLNTIKYVIGIKDLGILLQSKYNMVGFKLAGVSDSEYAGDQDTRISAYGYIHTFVMEIQSWEMCHSVIK